MSQREYIRQMPGQTGATLSPGLAMRQCEIGRAHV